MLFKQYVITTLMAAASLASALPRPDVIDLAVREADDYDIRYKRSTTETFVCKRGGKYVCCVPALLPFMSGLPFAFTSVD